MSSNLLNVIVHGHFYQPPRENPWTGYIDLQSSSYPFSNWNSRILSECYHPNSASRVINNTGDVEYFVNNYSYFSFDFGPTLLDWIYIHDIQVYEKILEADAESISRLGYGNAIAQAYNHTILPLSNQNDAETQIIWGVEHFKRHFKRQPEAMWLPETAINPMVIKLLIKHGIQYTFLSPSQAHSIIPIDQPMSSPSLVSPKTLDVSQPYRIFVDDHKEDYLDVLFYDFDLSSSVSFNHLLKDSHLFSKSLIEQGRHNAHPLVVIATDGETYGHHEPFGDMCFSYFSQKIAPQKNIRLVNGTYFLSIHPPKYEVVLKKGDKNRGVSWSCIHGVERWIHDCGCQTGGQPEWNQKWRTHLRKAFDILLNYIHKKLINFLPSLGLSHFNYLFLRNQYIHVISSNDRFYIQDFFNLTPIKSFKDKQKTILIHLMEMEKKLLFMYTSCGWFFADISGIEPRQNLMYAEFAISLAKKVFGELDLSFYYQELTLAQSNIDDRTALDFLKIDIHNYEVGVFTILSNVLANKLLLKDNQKSIDSKTTQTKIKNLKHKDKNFFGEITITHKTGFSESFDFLFLIKDNFSFSNLFFTHQSLDKNILDLVPSDATLQSYDHFLSYLNESSLSSYSTQEWISLSLKKEVHSVGKHIRELFSSLLQFSGHKNYSLPPYFHSLFSYFFSSEIIFLVEHMSFKNLTKLENFFQSVKKLRFEESTVTSLTKPLQSILLDNTKKSFKSQNSLKLSLIIDYISLLKKYKRIDSLPYLQEFVFNKIASPSFTSSPDDDWNEMLTLLCSTLSLSHKSLC